MTYRLPPSRWVIANPPSTEVDRVIQATGLSPLLASVLINRGFNTPESAQIHINPESQQLPSPLDEFSDLAVSINLIKEAIANQERIIICGDYDADGMTSTALLLRTLKHLGGLVDYAIPSRMKDGYGINNRLVEEFANTGVKLILTVDNGIAAYEPILKAKDNGMKVIITDHHDLPEKLPPADAILNPKLLSPSSPYFGLAGVGVAYILAVTTAKSLNLLHGLSDRLLELYTVGTIADLAPLVGVNRRWLTRGLKKLPTSSLAGIQALIHVSGVNQQQNNLKPEDIGFKLGPRINAVGRLSDPDIVIQLLTTDDSGLALEKAMQCHSINDHRQKLCEQIETEAIALIENTPIRWQDDRVLLLVEHNWHHGVIGIVASRLVERYGVPVFIATYEEEDPDKIRGSARGIEEFNIFEALEFSADLLTKFGGHPAAGGFSFPVTNLAAFKDRLRTFAYQCLKPSDLKPKIKIDALANFSQINQYLYQQIDSLQPWGIGNDSPLFATKNVRVIEQQILKGKHLKLTLTQDGPEGGVIKAIAWRSAEYFPLPTHIDIAFELKENDFNGEKSIQLELISFRLPEQNEVNKKATFEYNGRSYACSLWVDLNELRIKNDRGMVLVVNRGQKIGLLGKSRDEAKTINVTQHPYYDLIKLALFAMGEGKG